LRTAKENLPLVPAEIIRKDFYMQRVWDP